MPDTEIKGSVTANQPVTEANSAAILTSVQLIDDTVYTDGVGAPSKGLAVMGTDGANPQILLTDATGHLQVDVVGGGAAGTQYSDGDVRGTATGTLMMVDDGINIQSASGDNTGKLNVNISNTPAVTVTGSVTANAGTNLNTSALALEAGGNLATIAGDTTSIDGKITACNTGAVVVSSGTITETNSSAIKTAVETIDNAISGNEMQVDVVSSALPSGASTETTLAKLTTTYNQISIANDNVTTINYTDATKTAVSSIVQTSATLGLTVTETFNNSGGTTLVITRVVA